MTHCVVGGVLGFISGVCTTTAFLSLCAGEKWKLQATVACVAEMVLVVYVILRT